LWQSCEGRGIDQNSWPELTQAVRFFSRNPFLEISGSQQRRAITALTTRSLERTFRFLPIVAMLGSGVRKTLS
jgi:hypothetical protein